MPVDFDKLTLTPISACLVVEETASLWQIHAMLPPDRNDRLYRFVIVRRERREARGGRGKRQERQEARGGRRAVETVRCNVSTG
ncbi:hypothetical protein [Roseiflexus castenholzii]|uniref:Uncharacterized protein n=1 Tax=Roseiflexus castenholzii (strain DSM 13941 / HLO8) TaxID=383372 RepID=A7NJ73_ROSCS|nr:hypothetical protein [Roseiflexus castenholzii]ABU57539.1 hypothetical protein Rcas_1444 [Roseiflexus castenholzii DSM 13941]